MQALVTTPGKAHSTEVAEVSEPRPGPREVLLSDARGRACAAPTARSPRARSGSRPTTATGWCSGHELLGVVERDAHGFARGDLVAATVRRSCGHCDACAEGAPDACHTGDYLERGITRLDGFASELVAESAEHLVAVPGSLGRLGVLAEPASICARAIRHARAVGARQPWRSERALVVGTGAIGMLSTVFLRLEGFEVWAAGRSARHPTPRRTWARPCGARYLSTGGTAAGRAGRRDRGASTW